jgi:hypothetical protein
VASPKPEKLRAPYPYGNAHPPRVDSQLSEKPHPVVAVVKRAALDEEV